MLLRSIPHIRVHGFTRELSIELTESLFHLPVAVNYTRFSSWSTGELLTPGLSVWNPGRDNVSDIAGCICLET
jgi:hypothetical protein